MKFLQNSDIILTNFQKILTSFCKFHWQLMFSQFLSVMVGQRSSLHFFLHPFLWKKKEAKQRKYSKKKKTKTIPLLSCLFPLHPFLLILKQDKSVWKRTKRKAQFLTFPSFLPFSSFFFLREPLSTINYYLNLKLHFTIWIIFYFKKKKINLIFFDWFLCLFIRAKL